MDTQCTIYQTIDIISKRWALLVILELHRGGSGPKRFSGIRKSIKWITPRVLSARLLELQDQGLIRKECHKGKTVTTYYSLTQKGKDLIPLLQSIKSWGLRWNAKNPACKKSSCGECSL